MSPIRQNLALAAVGLPILATACAGGAASSGLSPAAEQGRAVAQAAGCMSCHGADGVGGVAPSWQGIAGTERTLDTGEVVVADREYLVRAIVDPQAERVAGYTIVMPTVNLSAEDVDAIVDYLEAVS